MKKSEGIPRQRMIETDVSPQRGLFRKPADPNVVY